jgi:hypothetical protein
VPWEVPKKKDRAAQKPPLSTVSFPSAGVRSALVPAVCRMLLLFWLELPLLLLMVCLVICVTLNLLSHLKYLTSYKLGDFVVCLVACISREKLDFVVCLLARIS